LLMTREKIPRQSRKRRARGGLEERAGTGKPRNSTVLDDKSKKRRGEVGTGG